MTVERWPTVSVIVPTCGRAGALARCLTALRDLRYSKGRYEILVVADGVDLAGRDVDGRLRCFSDVRFLRQPKAGPGAARNVGAREAVGQVLAFTDDDCRPAVDWLTEIVSGLRRAPDALAGGRIVNGLRRNPWSGASQLLVDYIYEYQGNRSKGERFFASNNLAVSAEGYRAVGGFDEGFDQAAEDRDLCRRWLEAGKRLSYVPEAVVFHENPLDARSYWKQHLNYGRGACRFHQLGHGGRAPKIEPLSFYTGLVGHPLRKQAPNRFAQAGLLAVSQIATAAGYLAERLAGRK